VIYLSEDQLDCDHAFIGVVQVLQHIVVKQSQLFEVLESVRLYDGRVPLDLGDRPGALVRFCGELSVVSQGLMRQVAQDQQGVLFKCHEPRC